MEKQEQSPCFFPQSLLSCAWGQDYARGAARACAKRRRQDMRKNSGFLHMFFGGKLRPRWDAWARGRGHAQPYARRWPRRGPTIPPAKKV